ncbi:MAG: protein translocase subunit SecD [Actinobacteria bacterium]|nr:protein translocase subunit SecD [Actinomycetota bacterium]
MVRALAALLGGGASRAAARLIPPRLGLDLRGGTQIVLQTRDGVGVVANAENTDRALEVLRKRVDALGVAEPTLARSGERRIIVELPGVQDPREAAEVIGRTAQLTFHPVLGPGDPADVRDPAAAGPATPADPSKEQTVPDEDGQPLRLGPASLTGSAVKDAAPQTDPQQGPGWFITIDFTGPGGTGWQQLTGQAACAQPGDPQRRVAIVLDDRVISSPQVDPSIGCNVGIGGGSTQITGQFTDAEARDLAALVRGGSLPLPVDVLEQRTVGPTLGDDAIDASTRAAIIGLALTALFITVVYRLVGLLATLALASYTLIAYGVLVYLGATLTLPGLAGFVLAIGLAIDANVLVFERAREEYAASATTARGTARTPRARLGSALTAGFDRAWSAILDSNVTTLIAAGLLFWLASGPVRGFGVTLGIGVIASMISALVVTRVLAEIALRNRWAVRHPGITGVAGSGRVRRFVEERGPDLSRRTGMFLAISALVLVVSFAGVALRGLNLGVEFTGGRLLQYATSSQIDVTTARAAVADAGFPTAVVQTSSEGGSDEVTVRTRPISNDEAAQIETALKQLDPQVTKESDELVGPTLGEELRNNALIALGVALAAQLLYLAFRFRWTFGLAAVLAMLHDVVAVVGLFAWLGRPVDGVFLAAALTIIGISVNDSVVVFDRVRETWRERPDQPFAKVASHAVLQTLPRTINTGIGAMAILAALTVLGGDSLRDVSLALLAGLVVGTWSTVATAVPLAAVFERMRARRLGSSGPIGSGAAPGGPGTAGRRTPVGAGASRGGGRWADAEDPTDPYAFVDKGGAVKRGTAD